VSGRGEAGGSRRALGALARGRSFLVVALATGVIAAALAAGCGGASSSADIGIYLGVWQRVEGGVANPGFTLTVARQGDRAAVTFADQAEGQSQTVAAVAQAGYLACTLSTGDKRPGQSAASGSPSPVARQTSASHLQLSVDENGQLIVDLTLPDGTLEPIWIYDRAAASPSAEP
jgi:hypothetical protein